MKKILVSSLLVVGLAVGSSAVVFAQNGGGATNNGPGAGYNMMGSGNGPGGNNSVYGGGYGMGPGMMGYGGGYGMGPGMMGYGGGYGMGPGMMGYGGCGYGNQWNGWRRPEQVQKFLDDTVDLRRKLNDKEFDLREALRKPSTTSETVAKLQKEIIDLRQQISQKAETQH